ncbi:MAG: hypothetical protein C4326_01210 [Ignavibacteria bacterium]
MRFRLQDADASLRIFLTMVLLVITVGYGVGLLFVEHTTALTVRGIEEQFLGNEEAAPQQEIRYAKSAHEMFVFMHNHILSLGMMFFVVGGIFWFSSLVSNRTKTLLMVEPLVAILTTFGGMALVRYVSPVFSWLVLLSGLSLALCYVAMVTLIVRELWFERP